MSKSTEKDGSTRKRENLSFQAMQAKPDKIKTLRCEKREANKVKTDVQHQKTEIN